MRVTATGKCPTALSTSLRGRLALRKARGATSAPSVAPSPIPRGVFTVYLARLRCRRGDGIAAKHSSGRSWRFVVAKRRSKRRSSTSDWRPNHLHGVPGHLPRRLYLPRRPPGSVPRKGGSPAPRLPGRRPVAVFRGPSSQGAKAGGLLRHLRFATLNVQTLAGRLSQILALLAVCNVDVACLQEVRVTTNHFPAVQSAARVNGYSAFLSEPRKGSN